MAPGLIYPGVTRFTVHGTYAGAEIANILDMHTDLAQTGTSRGDAIIDQAHIIVSAWCDQILPLVSNRYLATSVSWVDMNSSSGTTGETSDGTGTDFPNSGQDSGPPASANCAFLVHKQITAARGSRAGRMFLVGIGEGNTSTTAPNDIVAGWVAAGNTRLGDFLNAINQEAGISGASYDSKLVVCHTRNAGTPEAPNIVANGYSNVSALTMDGKVHSQRRRL